MNFITPLAFSLAALLPIVVALYFLKLRREERRVSSTYLWRTLVRDTAANAPWQRLKPNLLLFLQLLFLILLILALARPFVWSEAAAGSHLILVIDTSASMGATDVSPHRLGAAIASARQLVERLPASARITLIEAGAQVRIPVSGATDPTAALAALAALQVGPGGADFTSALALAAAIAAREPDSDIVILSDGGVELFDNLILPGRVRYLPVGRAAANQAIGAFSLQPEAGGQSLTAFVQAANYGTQTVHRRLTLREAAGGQLLAARDMTLTPGKPQAVIIPNLPAQADAIVARLEGQDLLPADDEAWAVSPSAARIPVNLITPGNRFLETALRLLPNVELTTDHRPPTTDRPTNQPTNQPTDRPTNQPTNQLTNQLTIFDTLVPTTPLPAGPLLFIAPPRSTELFSVTGMVLTPTLAPVTADDPLLRYAEADWRDVAVRTAVRIALPRWGRAALVDDKTGAPLLIIGELGGRPVGLLAFDLRQSDLPLRVAFPILMANLIDALTPGGAAGIPSAVIAGRAIAIPAPPQASAVKIAAPDGREYTLIPSAGRVVFEQTHRRGVYQVGWQAGAGQVNALGRFAVNLFDAREADIAPRAALPVSGAGAAGGESLPRARNEWWRPLAWLALGVLVAEWLLSQRGQVTKLLKLLMVNREL